VFVGQRLELLLLDEAALGGLLEQVLGRRKVVQINRVAQLNPSLIVEWATWVAAPGVRRAGFLPAIGLTATSSYRTAGHPSPFPNIANLRFPYRP
jgi:hypothetical protein